MSARTLEQAFNAVFHKEESFSDFCTLDFSQEVEEIVINGRQVYRVSSKLKKYLRFIDKVMLRHLDKNDGVVHSYVKEKSILTAVSGHAKSRVFFLTDIKSFFSNIGEVDVERILRRDRRLVPISDFDVHIADIVRMVILNGEIPIGFPTSPSLSNGFLLEFDNALNNFCESQGLIYTRYSDDIIVSGGENKSLVGLRGVVQDLLHQHASENLYINPKKTRITHVGNKIKILGLVITQNGRVTIDSKYKIKVESLLHFYVSDRARYIDLLDKKFNGSEHSLFGLLHYINSTDQKYLEKLQRKYGASVLRTLMEDRSSDAH